MQSIIPFSRSRVGPIASALTLALCGGAANAVEIITLRSGQVSGVPGLPGQLDDIVKFNPNNGAGPISPLPFTAADFSAANSGGPAVLVDPYTPFWVPGLSDPNARWINFARDSSGLGTSGSSLYSVPFNVTTTAITSATITLEFAVDNVLGDMGFGGGNPDGLYLNGNSTGFGGGSFNPATFHTQSITAWLTPGLNHLQFYQRELSGAGVGSGLIFSARITVVPAPASIALLGLGGVAASRRRRA
jgi:hypothetical protein